MPNTAEIKARKLRVALPESLLETAARTGRMDELTRRRRRWVRAADLTTSLCAVLLAEACNPARSEALLPWDCSPEMRKAHLVEGVFRGSQTLFLETAHVQGITTYAHRL